MNFLQEGHHASHQQADIVVVGWPDNYRIEFLLEVTNLYNSLVGEEGLVGGGREMILEDMQAQLVDNAKLDFVAANGDWQGPPGKRQ